MRDGSRRTWIALLLVFLMAASGLSGIPAGAGDDGAVPIGGPVPFDVSPWTDDFDDGSLVNTTIDTEVVGGQVQLEAGKASGLVASVPIGCPAGYRYDILIVEVDTPGSSSVEISFLNATEESTKVGYVNEPIPGFLKLAKTQISLAGVSPKVFPSVRLQADLQSSGTDRPALLKWTLHYVAEGMWRDEFWGDGKVEESTRLVFDGERVSVDLSVKSLYETGYADHDPFPVLIADREGQQNRLEMGVFYTNIAGNDWESRTQLYAENPGGFVAGDLDGDGFLDLVVANHHNGNDFTRDSWILWGDPSGRWDVARRTNLSTDRGREPALGDEDGDGDLDVLIAVGGGSGSASLWYNERTRTYPTDPHADLPGSNINGIACMDLNDDGYEDVVLAENYDTGTGQASRAYYGSISGIDPTADRTYPTGDCQDVCIGDFDADGWPDIAFANTLPVGGNDRAHVFMGGPNGPDQQQDFLADVPDNLDCIAAGDINADGYDDFVIGRSMQQPRMYIFYGSASGPGNRDDPRIPTSMRDNIIIDVNGDGYDDVLSAAYWSNRIDVFHGSASGVDGQADDSVDTSNPISIAVGVPRKEKTYLMGTMVSTVINRPLDKKWDILVLEADLPTNTTMSVSILDTGKQPILGYQDLEGPDIDLSGISIPGIHIQITLRSNDRVTTPTLERMFVKWMDANVWREEYYGYAKVDQISGFTVTGGQMVPDAGLVGGPEIVFSNLRSDVSYQTPSLAFRDAGGMDYASIEPLRFRVPSGASDVEVIDANGDGYTDVLFSVLQTSSSNYIADSPLFLGSPVGFDPIPTLKFPTIGARDVLVADLNNDGHMDVVFAQEQDAGDYAINSTLYWGSATGWKTRPDVEFVTTGASGVAAADIDKDGLKDLVFACYRNAATTSIDSQVYIQTDQGFNGSSPDVFVPTKGARGVALADLDGDGWQDAVFANSISGGFAEIASNIFWGTSSGSFGLSPVDLPTMGAQDVVIADVNVDGEKDIVFPNYWDNGQNRVVDSYIYLGAGSRTWSTMPNAAVPTIGATSVAVADLDGTGWKDLVFACQFDGATHEIGSWVYLGGAGGYGSSPDITLPTAGASGVVVADIVPKDKAGYLSKVITPEKPDEASVFHTFRYNAVNLPSGHTGTIYVLDAGTGQVLASTSLLAGANEYDLSDKFRIREHAAIQLLITVDGLNPIGGLAIDDLWINWTERFPAPPEVLDMHLSASSVLRTQTIRATINVSDEYDYLDELTVRIQHRRTGTSDPWTTFMISGLGFVDDMWQADINPKVDIPVGVYDFRVMVTDTDGMDSGWQVLSEALEVLNNLPSAPEIEITPARAMVTAPLEVNIKASAIDIESPSITYEYTWFLDGVLVPDLVTSRVPASRLLRGQNWSVEVRANDTDDLGPAVTDWKLIENAPPFPAEDLPDPLIDEDTTDNNWLVLADAFDDPDGDSLEWSVDPQPSFVVVEIDPDTGRVTLMPILNWHGSEEITFYASDGEFRTNQTVTVHVTPVNDPPVWVTVNGEPYDGGVVELEVLQDATLVIDANVFDVEGDDLFYRVSDTQIILNLTSGRMTFNPDNDDIGWLNFSLTVNDNVDRDIRIQADFAVWVVNVNDIMEEPRIISPSENDAFKWNESVGLRAVCTDPDEQWGQELNYTWSSNRSGSLGTGQTINFRFTDSGLHLVTLKVSDGEFEKTVTVNMSVGEPPQPPPPPPPPEDEGIPMWMIILAVLVVVGAVVAIFVVTRRRGEPEPEPVPTLSPEEQKRKDLEDFRDAVAATAAAMEAERDADRAKKDEEDDSIEVVGTGMVPSAQASHRMRLSEQTSDETAKLWADMEKETPAMDEAEKEELAKENRKRKLQSAIEALPYGIPAPALRHISPEQLATDLVEGATHELPDGTVLIAIRGKWYYGDPEDSSKFLMPYEKKEGPIVTASSSGSEWEEEG